MAPISNHQNSSTTGNDREVEHAVLQALVPFSGAYSPDEVRRRMAGPSLNGPTGAIWIKTTIQHSNTDGSFYLYACERTGEAMWVPSGDFFVADRPHGVSPKGTVMDYLFTQKNRQGRSEGYGRTYVNRLTPSEERMHQEPRRHPIDMRPRPAVRGPARSHCKTIHRTEPSATGAGSNRTVARRERRERARVIQVEPTATVTTSTTTTPTLTTTKAAPPAANTKTRTPVQNATALAYTPPATPTMTKTKPTSTMVFHNSTIPQHQPLASEGDRNHYRVGALNLSDSDSELTIME